MAARVFITLWRPIRLGQTVELLPEAPRGRVVDRTLMFTVDVLAYLRTHATDRVLVALNFAATARRHAMPAPFAARQVVLSSDRDRPLGAIGESIEIGPAEEVVIAVA